MSKALGAEIKQFWEEGFPQGYYHDDSSIEITDEQGDVCLEADEKYELNDCGVLVEEGDGLSAGEVISFASEFRKWKKKQTVAIIVIEVPANKAESVRKELAEAGYKVKSGS